MKKPTPMLLWCPACGERHIDRGRFTSKPHHTHACQGCGMVWRPALIATVGVQYLPGFKDEASLSRAVAKPLSTPVVKVDRAATTTSLVLDVFKLNDGDFNARDVLVQLGLGEDRLNYVRTLLARLAQRGGIARSIERRGRFHAIEKRGE